MANGKTHLLVGIGVAVAANYFWQRSRMDADPKRRFEWGEMAVFGACGGAVGLLADILEPATDPNHRGFFHSFCFAGLVVWALFKFGGRLGVRGAGFVATLVLSYLSHLFLDSLTPRCLPWIGRWRCW